MRFSITFQWHSNRKFFYLNYHRFIISILKKSFEVANKDLYSELFVKRKNKIKPYTFSIFLPDSKFTDKGIILSSDNEIVLNFSTFDTEVGLMFYNGLIKQVMKKFFISIKYKNDDVNLKLKNVVLRREKKIEKNKILFKTLSPIILREHIKETNKDIYFTPENNTTKEKLSEVLNKNMYSVFKEFFNKEYKLTFDNLKLNSVRIKMTDGESQKGYIIGNIGKFELEGDIEALDFVYKAGLGARRSFGFGMVEVINE